MTIINWVNRVRRKLKLNPIVSLTDEEGHWNASELLDIYNDVADMFCEETRCIQGTSTDSLVDSQREYDYGSDWGEILGVWFDNKPLQGYSVDEIDFTTKNQAWRETEDSEPYGWYVSETSGKYGILDVPSANDTDALTIWHTVIPDHFTTSSTQTTELLNSVSALKPYHSALVYLGIAQCEFEDGNPEKAAVFQRMGDQLTNKLKRKLKYNKRILPSMLTGSGKDGQFGTRYWTK